jgi:hypothetical protein
VYYIFVCNLQNQSFRIQSFPVQSFVFFSGTVAAPGEPHSVTLGAISAEQFSSIDDAALRAD